MRVMKGGGGVLRGQRVSSKGFYLLAVEASVYRRHQQRSARQDADAIFESRKDLRGHPKATQAACFHPPGCCSSAVAERRNTTGSGRIPGETG